MKRVAVCSYWYPPTQTIASLRIGKFVKYLPEYGWEPFVFTVAPRTDRYTRAGTLPDEGLPGHVHRIADPSVHSVVDRLWRSMTGNDVTRPLLREKRDWSRRVAFRAYNEVLRFPDESWPWLLRYRGLREAVARVQPDVIFSSSPPATAHLLARRLSLDLGVPWVADLRDLWAGNQWHVRSALHRRAESWLEQRTLRAARAITTVSKPFLDHFSAEHQRPTILVANGFDDDMPASCGCGTSGRMVLAYTGLLYETSTAGMLFAAMDRALAKGRLDAERVAVEFYGRGQDVAAVALERFPRVRPLVSLRGEVSHAAAREAQRRASVLLLLESPEQWTRGAVAGKFFEYLAAGRFVLATAAPGGEVDRLLRDTRAGALAPTVDALEETLERLGDEFARTGRIAVVREPSFIARYSRRSLTADLANVFDSVATRRSE